MAGNAVVVLRDKTKVTHNGAVDFDITPFVPHIEHFVELSAISEVEELEHVLNPAPDVTLERYTRWFAKICGSFMEVQRGLQVIAPVLERNPNDVDAIKVKLELLKMIGEHEQARELKAHLQSVTGEATPKGVLEPEDIGLAYSYCQDCFFRTKWADDEDGGWSHSGKLASAFLTWARKNHEDLVEDCHDSEDPNAVENFIEDEEGGEALADFVNNLAAPLRKEAYVGMKASLLFEIEHNGEDKALPELIARIDAATAELA